MALNKVKPGSNMYGWIDATWNPIRGECQHQCKYCYIDRRYTGPLRLEERVLADALGNGKRIFLGSSTDMFAENVPLEWIERVLKQCCQSDNTYLFQTKNPLGLFGYMFPNKTIFGVTIESNRYYPEISRAPTPMDRYLAFIRYLSSHNRRRMVSIEPVMDFNLGTMLHWMRTIGPEFVSIGADSKEHRLPEPSKEKIIHLISGLSEFTDVKVKKNLDRIFKTREKK